MRPKVITAALGYEFTHFWPAPRHTNAIVFGNSPKAEIDALKKGWSFVLMDQNFFQLSQDQVISSLHSKYIKFLGFLDYFPEFSDWNTLTYVDHKVPLTRDIRSVRPFVNEVIETCVQLGQPECRIIWAALSQQFDYLIQRIEWNEIGIEHSLPL